MSIIKVLYGLFSQKEETFEFTDVIKVKDALSHLDLTSALVSINGQRCDIDTELHDNEICYVRILPKGGGGANGWNLIDTTMTILTGGLWGVGSAIYGACTGKTWGKELFDRALDDNAQKTKTQEQVESVPYIRGAQNQSIIGKSIPYIMGKHLLVPYYCGHPYTQITGDDGEEQYMYILLMLGYNKLKVSDIKIGEQRLATNTANVLNGTIAVDNPDMVQYDAKLEIQQGNSDVSLYPYTVYEEQLEIELLNTKKDRVFKNEPKRFSGKNPMKVEVEIYIPSLISYDDETNPVDASVTVKVLYRWSTLEGNTSWTAFGGFTGANSYQDGSSTITRKKARNMRFVASKTFNYNDIPLLDGELYPSATLEIQVTRESENPTDNRTSSQVYLSGIRTWSYDYEKSKLAKTLIAEKPVCDELMGVTARLGLRIKASKDLSGQIESINCVLQSYARTWDGSKWSTNEYPTSNPASICLKTLQSNMLGVYKKTDDEIDLVALGKIYDRCEDVHTGDLPEINKINKRGCKLRCNGVLTTPVPLRDLLVRILRTGRSYITNNSTKFSAIFDCAKSQYVTILNNQNVLKADNSKTFEDIVDGFKIKFIDETDNWQENTMYLNFEDGTTTVKANYEYTDIDMTYCTHRDEVWHNAMFEGAKKMYRKESWVRKLSVDGSILSTLDLIQLQDDTIVVGIGDGAEIIGLEKDETGQYIKTIHTDGRFNVSNMGKAYGIKIIQADGVNEPTIRVCKVTGLQAGLLKSFELASPIHISERIKPSVGDIIAFGEYGKETIESFVVDKKPNGDGTYEVTLLPYSHQVYEYETTRVMPVFDSKINPPQPTALIREIPQEPVTLGTLYQAVSGVKSRYTIDVTPDTLMIPCDDDGIPRITGNIHFEVALYQGSNLIEDAEWSATVNGMTVPIEDHLLDVPTSVLKTDVTEITIKAVVDNETVTKIVSVSKLYGGASAKLYKLIVEPEKIKDQGTQIPPIDIRKRVVDTYGERDTEHGHVTIAIDKGKEQAIGWIPADETFNTGVDYGVKFEPIMLSVGDQEVLAAEADVAAVFYRRIK